jgi:hypothetical protein
VFGCPAPVNTGFTIKLGDESDTESDKRAESDTLTQLAGGKAPPAGLR